MAYCPFSDSWTQPTVCCVQIRLASNAAGMSTASMGKFDKRAVGEKEGERAPVGKRRKLAPVVDKSGSERTSQVCAGLVWPTDMQLRVLS